MELVVVPDHGSMVSTKFFRAERPHEADQHVHNMYNGSLWTHLVPH